MYEMTIVLNMKNGKSLYEQIYEYIRNEIKEGKLLQGEKLPSTRSLAEYLQVSRSTVELAYEQLQAEGYIEARPYKGFFVCRLEELVQLDEVSRIKLNLEVGNENRNKKYDYDFSPFQIDMNHFPFSVWKKINKEILSNSNIKLFSQGNVQGDLSLRKAISRYLHASRGVNCSEEQIVVGAGNDYLLLLLEKILGRHVKIAMENPTYKRAYQIFKSFAYEITTVNMDEAGMMVEELEKENVTAAYVMPSHQHPTGIVMPIGRRRELLNWANGREERYLIEDDYDSEFRYKGKPIPSLQASDRRGKVIYIGTFSKAIAPAIRVSYMVLPLKLLTKYKEECYFYSSTVSRIDQKILEEFLTQGYFERYLNKMRKVYKGKHDFILDKIGPLKKDFTVTGEHGGLHILLTNHKGISEEELIEKARNEGVKVYGLSDSFVSHKQHSSTVLLGYGGLSEEEIDLGIEKIKKAWLI